MQACRVTDIGKIVGALLCLSLAACSGGMSPQLRREAQPIAGFSELRSKVGEWTGDTVILGGEIIEVRNESMAATTLLVLERPLGMDRRPNPSNESGGRFMVHFDRYLDPEVFRKGLDVTVGGIVEGTATEPVGQAPYQYVVLRGREIYVWKTYDRAYDYPLYYYYPYPYGRFHFHGAYWVP